MDGKNEQADSAAGPESEQPSRARRIGELLLIRLPVYLAVVLLLYVLSIGPMYWTWYESYAMYESHEVAMANSNEITLLYLPLAVLCDHCQPVEEYVNWYLDFWV